MRLYEKVEKYVIDSFTTAGKIHQIEHFKNTVKWIKRLKPDADEALLIAAIAHDIERATRKEDMIEMKKKYGLTSKKFLRTHQTRCAKAISEFLNKQGADKKLIFRVKMLVSRHEEGGNKDQNLLKDADSVSFFKTNVPYFLSSEKIKDVGGKERTEKKLTFMYNRISSKKAKQIVKPLYEKAIKKLESL
jgi:hypothetical protein